MEGLWRFALIALFAVASGGLVGVLLGGASSDDPYATVVETVKGKPRTVTETETKTVTKTVTEEATDESADPLAGDAESDRDPNENDDADGDSCSDSYEPACLDPSDGYNDLSCREAGDTDFSSIGDDPYGLDPDQDGVACESTE
jgi:hypothetical protein